MTIWQDDIPVTLTATSDHHKELLRHLFPGDGKEAAAIALCNRRAGAFRHRLLVQEIHGIPHDVCTLRGPTKISWPTEYIEPWLNMAEERKMSLVKFHSHPNGIFEFSEIDDQNDYKFLPAVKGWIDSDIPHGSVVVTPDGKMSGRVISNNNEFIPISTISIVGSDLLFWHSQKISPLPGFTESHAQAFGEGTTRTLGNLCAAVVGCSGTGSITIELLHRLGIGTLIIVDDDIVEDRNLNRIIHSTRKDAEKGRFKADVLAEVIQKSGLNTKVIAITKNLWDPEVVRLVAQCDLLFGCMDTVDGRFLLNTLASCYLQPYFDVGVRLDAIPSGSEKGRIREVCGSVHYLQPGKSSLLSRGLITMKAVAAAGLERRDASAYRQQLKDGYIKGITEDRPAVVSVNMALASRMVNDLLSRLHPYREQSNDDIAWIEESLSSLELFLEPESAPCRTLSNLVGRGDIAPLLNLPELSEAQ